MHVSSCTSETGRFPLRIVAELGPIEEFYEFCLRGLRIFRFIIMHYFRKYIMGMTIKRKKEKDYLYMSEKNWKSASS